MTNRNPTKLILVATTSLVCSYAEAINGCKIEPETICPSAELAGADLNRASLSSADLSGSNLDRANLTGAELSYSDLRGADLTGADLSGADLSGADLSDADLSFTDLRGANVRGVNVRMADLSGTDLNLVDLYGANYNAETKWPEGFDPVGAGAAIEAYVNRIVDRDNEEWVSLSSGALTAVLSARVDPKYASEKDLWFLPPTIQIRLSGQGTEGSATEELVLEYEGRWPALRPMWLLQVVELDGANNQPRCFSRKVAAETTAVRR